MAIVHVQDNVTSNATTATPACAFTTANITSGNFIVAMCASTANVTVSGGVTDSAGNSYSAAITKTDATNAQMASIYYAQITAGGGTKPTVTFHLSGSTGSDVSVYEFSGVATSSPVDKTASSTTGSSGTAVTSTAMATTTNANDLLIGTCCVGGTVTAGETNWTNVVDPDGNAAQYRIVTATGAYAATWTQNTSSAYTAVVASFLPAGGTVVLPSVTMQALIGITSVSVQAGVPLLWDSTMTLWDSAAAAWDAGAPMTWDAPSSKWDDSLLVWDAGPITWDSPYDKWDDGLGWAAGYPITWDSRDPNSTWDSVSAVWDVGNITWDCLNAKWDDPLVAWDAGKVAVYDSAITTWDSAVTNWDFPAVNLGSTSMGFTLGASTVKLVALLAPAMQFKAGITSTSIVEIIGSVSMQFKAGITSAKLAMLVAPAMQFKAGITTLKLVALVNAAMQAKFGITAVTIREIIGPVTMQATFGITTISLKALTTTNMVVHIGITTATVTGGGGGPPPTVTYYYSDGIGPHRISAQ